MKKLIIFDLDGVLVDACEWHYKALNNALIEVSDYQISRKDHLTKFNGLPTKVKLNMLVEEGIVSPGHIDKICDLKQYFTIHTIKRRCRPNLNIIETLSALKEKGYYLACYTNSIRQTGELMLEKSGVLPFLDFWISNEDVVKPKPDPNGYNFLMSYFKVSEQDTYIVEDSPKGLAAAKASGANVIQVKNSSGVNVDLFVEVGLL